MKEENEKFISVIVINLNDGNGLKKTLASIASQSFKDYEVICVDGGSQDNSLHVLETYSELITKTIVGKDSGIYNAMNIGITNSESRYLLFLNAGDYLYDKDVFRLVNIKVSELSDDIFIFGYAEISSDNCKWLFPPQKETSELLSVKQWLKHSEPNHQAMFFPKGFCLETLFDENLLIIADRKFKRLAIDKLDFVFIEFPIVRFSLGGVSNDIKNTNILWKFIRDYHYYYISEQITVSGLYRMIIANVKIILKYGFQRIFGGYFWVLLKYLKKYN